VENIAFSAEIY